MQLAEKLNITDRAISKWETGKSLPDASVMLELCGILKITVNDLLSGEVVMIGNYNKELENNLIEMIKDSYQYEKFSSLILEDLQADGLTAPQAISALEIFFKAFGYPGYRDALQNPVSEFISYDSGNFKIKHKGETKNGKEYGIGRRDNFYEGKSCGFDECNWIDGRMLGYCYSLEVEMEAFETKKYGFVLNDYYVGKYMLVYEDGTEEYMIGKPFPVQ